MCVLDEDAADDVSSYLGDEPGRFGAVSGPEAITPSGPKRELGTDPSTSKATAAPQRFDGVRIVWSCISHSGHHESLVDKAPNCISIRVGAEQGLRDWRTVPGPERDPEPPCGSHLHHRNDAAVHSRR